MRLFERLADFVFGLVMVGIQAIPSACVLAVCVWIVQSSSWSLLFVVPACVVGFFALLWLGMILINGFLMITEKAFGSA